MKQKRRENKTACQTKILIVSREHRGYWRRIVFGYEFNLQCYLSTVPNQMYKVEIQSKINFTRNTKHQVSKIALKMVET